MIIGFVQYKLFKLFLVFSLWN